MTTYAQDIEFVFDEVARFARMNLEERRKLSFPDVLARLPQPSGKGDVRCGIAAYRRLRELADLAVSRSRKYAGRIEPEAVFQELGSVIVQRFLHEGRELNKQQADRAVSSAIKRVAKACTDLTHYIPCDLADDETPVGFSIGPVTFHQYSSICERLEPALQAYLNQNQSIRSGTGEPEDRREIADMVLSDARKYYGSFRWVAEVTVTCCAPSTSRRRADRIVQNAVDCLHLLVGAAHSNYMRAGGTNFRIYPDRRGRIAVNSDGIAEVSGLINLRGHSLGDGWWDLVNSNGGDRFVALMGVAINAGHDAPRPAPAAQRFLDGVAWYGEAVRDDFAASSLVKYVIAIERILTTKDQNVSETLADRGAALVLESGEGDFESLRERFKKVYGLRSRLVHGSRSPMDVSVALGLREAERLAQLVLFGALPFYGRRGLEAPTVSEHQLENAFERRLEWARKSIISE